MVIRSASLDLEKTGEVIAVSPAVASSTRTFKVKVGLDNKDSYFSSGIFCSCIFKLDTIEGAFGVPREAIQNNEGQTFVWVNDNNKAKRIIVQPGEGKDGLVHITSGLKGNEQVIVNGGGALHEVDGLEILQ